MLSDEWHALGDSARVVLEFRNHVHAADGAFVVGVLPFGERFACLIMRVGFAIGECIDSAARSATKQNLFGLRACVRGEEVCKRFFKLVARGGSHAAQTHAVVELLPPIDIEAERCKGVAYDARAEYQHVKSATPSLQV